MRRFLLAFSLAVLFAMPALAQPHHPYGDSYQERDWKDGARPAPPRHGQKAYKMHGPQMMPVSPRFDETRRRDLMAYYRKTYRGHCPPGYYKHRRSCKQIRQTHRYRVGGQLPRIYQTVPPSLARRLGPPPHGAFYAYVDNDVVLASEATKKILDAVTLFSAMQK